MISIHNDMTSHGFASEKAPHTRIPGIWKKLDQLYDLETLDARENEHIFEGSPDPTNPQEAESLPDFELPEDDFGKFMWESRFEKVGSSATSSPPVFPIEDQKTLYVPGLGLLKDVPDVVHSTKDESVAEATPPPTKKSTRASRSAVKGTKSAKSGAAVKNSKAQSTVSDSEENEENEEDDDEDSSSESEEEEEEDSAPTTRRTNRAKAKPAPRRGRKRRIGD